MLGLEDKDIIEYVGSPAVLEQCAEEGTELSKACLKMARKLRGENPTPRTIDDIHEEIIDEIADVLLCVDQVAYCCNIDFETDIRNVLNAKRHRWKQRCAEDQAKYKEKKMKNYDDIALNLVISYIQEHLDKSDDKVKYDTYIVWKCKTLQNWKYLISSTLSDGMYYEITYNGDKYEWYLDAYKKFENRCIKMETLL